MRMRHVILPGHSTRSSFKPAYTVFTHRYAWLLSCPGAPAVAFTGPNPVISVAPGGNIDSSNLTEFMRCPLVLTVTDATNANATSSTNINVL